MVLGASLDSGTPSIQLDQKKKSVETNSALGTSGNLDLPDHVL